MIKKILAITGLFILGTLQANAACKNNTACDIEFIFEAGWEAMACGSVQENYYVVKSNIPVETPLSTIIERLSSDTSPDSSVKVVGGSCENGLPAKGTCQLNVRIEAAPCPIVPKGQVSSFPQLINRNLEVRPETSQANPIVANIQLEVLAGASIQFVEPLPTIDDMVCGGSTQDLTYTLQANLTEVDIPITAQITASDSYADTVSITGGSCIAGGVIPASGVCEIDVLITSASCSDTPFPHTLERVLTVTPSGSIPPISSDIDLTVYATAQPMIEITSIVPPIDQEIECGSGISVYTYTVESINATGDILIDNTISPLDDHVGIIEALSCDSIPQNSSCEIYVNINPGTCEGTFPVNINTNLVITPTDTSISPISSPIETDIVNVLAPFTKAYIANDTFSGNTGQITICDVDPDSGDLINCYPFTDPGSLGQTNDIVLNNEGTFAYVAIFAFSTINANQISVYSVSSTDGELIENIQNYEDPSFNILGTGLRIYNNQLYVVNSNANGPVTVCDLNSDGTISTCTANSSVDTHTPWGRMGVANIGTEVYQGYFANHTGSGTISICGLPLPGAACSVATAPTTLVGLDINTTVGAGYLYVMNNASGSNTLYSCQLNGSGIDACNSAGLFFTSTFIVPLNLFMQSVNGNNFGYIPAPYTTNPNVQKCTISGGTVSDCVAQTSDDILEPLSTWIQHFTGAK